MLLFHKTIIFFSKQSYSQEIHYTSHCMADGNFNRTHLPYRPFQSGLNAGRAQMHTLAIQAFEKWMEEQHFSEEEKKQHELRFRELLPL